MQQRKVLVLSTHGFGNGSMYPFIHYREALKQRFNISSEEIISDSLQDKLRCIMKREHDIYFICVHHKEDRRALVDFYREVEREKGDAKIVHFDYGDGQWSPHFDVLPYVDLFLKQYLNRDMDDYQRDYRGGSQLIDFLVRNGQPDSILNEVWTGLFSSDLPERYYPRVKLGWNFGLWRRMIYLAEGRGNLVLWAKDKPHRRLASLGRQVADRLRARSTGVAKPIDLYCRATLYAGWTRQHRVDAIDYCNELATEYNVVSSVNKVSFSDYYREMALSKIFVSPSGWCEYTPKDYEAMYFGALLMKPCCEHIDSEPGIFIPNETYVPLKWDLSDLTEKCRFFLEHPQERDRIANNARKAFVDYYQSNQFVEKFGELLASLYAADRSSELLNHNEERVCA